MNKIIIYVHQIHFEEQQFFSRDSPLKCDLIKLSIDKNKFSIRNIE